MNITYFHHSGFAVELARTVLVFDYYTENRRYDLFQPEKYKGKDIIFFVSHAHGDHYDPVILNYSDKAAYVASCDVSFGESFKGEVICTSPNKTYNVGDITIETLRSNDEGVAFLVTAEGKCIYHGGDLNWWHWNGESDAFNEEIALSYKGETDRLKGRGIDVAFIAADLRLQDKYSWAIEYFMKAVGAEYVFPMHFWRHFEVCERLKEFPFGSSIMLIKAEGQSFCIEEQSGKQQR